MTNKPAATLDANVSQTLRRTFFRKNHIEMIITNKPAGFETSDVNKLDQSTAIISHSNEQVQKTRSLVSQQRERRHEDKKVPVAASLCSLEAIKEEDVAAAELAAELRAGRPRLEVEFCPYCGSYSIRTGDLRKDPIAACSACSHWWYI